MTNEMRLLKDETNRNRLAKEDFRKNFLISAGAGAGKTYTTVQRAFNMLCDPDLGIGPQDIVMITFTRKAAKEMKERLNEWVRGKIDEETDTERKALLENLLARLPEMQISTIHSFCRKVLSAFPLQSGTGFAPEYDSEDERPSDSLSESFFKRAWATGLCSRSMDAGIPDALVKSAFSFLNNRPSVSPQFIDPDSPDGRDLYEKNLDECKRLIRNIRESTDQATWSMLNSRIRTVLLEKDNATEEQIFTVGSLLAGKGGKAQKWMNCKMGKTLCQALQPLSKVRRIIDEDIQKAEEILFKPGKVSKEEKKSVYESLIPGLPAAFRGAAEVAALLPSEEELKDLDERINLMRHGIAVKDALLLRERYEQYRRENHIVTLMDMLHMTAEAVKNPEVRRRLHERYKVFFVDEYQDTDPIQTDIIFAIAAELYDPDWHNSKPAPGSLFMVGDAKQAIYRFRGADISLWKEAQEAIDRSEDGEILDLYRNYRSTDEICDVVEKTFGSGGPLAMNASEAQAEFMEMVSNRGHGVTPAVIHHVITSEDKEATPDFYDAALRIAEFIWERVQSGRNSFGDFLLISFNKETCMDYTDVFRDFRIPIVFDGKLPMNGYKPIQRLNLRVQSVCHPFDETLAFRVLNECFGVKPKEWDLFRMNLKQLPREIIDKDEPTVHTAVFAEKKLEEILPQTEMNLKILHALKQMSRDDLLSRNLTPCAFLRDLTENVDGLFTEEMYPEDYQNHYAVILHVIDSVEQQHPEHFTEMADILNSYATGEMAHMPSVRADYNYVRLMNLHKVKGLEGRVVIFLPCTTSAHPPENHVERDGLETKGWMVLKEPGNNKSAQYRPPEWKEQSEKEKTLLEAEETRKLYVALTRAKDEIHFFDFPADAGGKKKKNAWSGFEDLGETVICEPQEDGIIPDEKVEGNPQAEREALQALIDPIIEKHYARVTPSTLEKKDELPVGEIDEEEEAEDAEDEDETAPGGKDWGTAIHRAAELIVTEGIYTEDSIRRAVVTAVGETFRTEILSKSERDNLQIPETAKTLEEIRAYLAEKAFRTLLFMTDENSEFRKTVVGAEVFAEMPFTVSITEEENKDVFFRLKAAANRTSAKEISLVVSGKIDLALHYPDGTWMILDYKTDRMLPDDHGSRDAFLARLNCQYRNQLEIYRIVLEYLTGEKVIEAKILSV